MYIGALIELSDGTRKIVESVSEHESIAILSFTSKIAKYAKKENKLIKVFADDYNAFQILKKSLGMEKVEFGFISGDYPRE